MKKKLLFGITGLTLGGAERVLVDLANELSNKYDITIFTIYSKGELEKQLCNSVKLKSFSNNSYSELSKIQKIIMPIKILLFKNKIYNKYIKGDYDTEIAFLEGPITRLFSVKNNKTRKIVWVHNDISLVFGNGIKAKLKKNIDKKIYSKYGTLVFVSKDNLNRFNEVYKSLDEVNKEVIYNYINKENIIKNANQEEVKFDSNKLNFVTVARLTEQKAIDRLIEVHNKLIKEGLQHNFYVIGDGPERQKLKEMVNKYQINDTFHLLGKKENPYPYVKSADYFCLLSEFEGYGMVLEEAKILNKSIIITDTAAREAVEGYKNSILLNNDKKSIYNGLKEKIIQGKNNTEFKQQYDNEKIIKNVIDLLEK